MIGKDHISWREGAPTRADEWVCPGCGKRLGLRVVLSHLADKHRIKKRVRCVNCNIELPGFVSICPFCEDRTHKLEVEEPYKPEVEREGVVEEPSEVLFCIKCGGKLDSDSRFCIKCGTEVKEV